MENPLGIFFSITRLESEGDGLGYGLTEEEIRIVEGDDMESKIIIFAILIFVIIGFLKMIFQRLKIIENTDFINLYRNNFLQFSNSYILGSQNSNSFVLDNGAYNWLIMNSVKAQDLLQGWGYMNYKPAYKDYYIKDYPLILNTLPKFRSTDLEMFDLNSVDDSLLRYLGELEVKFRYINQNLFNPIVLFKEGVKEVLSWPILFLVWFGLLNNSTLDSIKHSGIFSFFAGIISLVAFVSGLVTILIGADESIEIIRRIFNK